MLKQGLRRKRKSIDVYQRLKSAGSDTIVGYGVIEGDNESTTPGDPVLSNKWNLMYAQDQAVGGEAMNRCISYLVAPMNMTFDS